MLLVEFYQPRVYLYPFLGYGGSSIIATLIATALLIRVARESNEAEIVPLRRQLKNKREQRFLNRNKL